MAKLIDKDALVEELKKLKQNLSASPIVVIEDVESLVESLEVKDVDLEKEVDEMWNYIFSELGWDENTLMAITHKEFMALIKHFFELGLRVNNEKEK